MWIVEVNVLGRRFTLAGNGRPEVLRHTTRPASWRGWKQRSPQAAA